MLKSLVVWYALYGVVFLPGQRRSQQFGRRPSQSTAVEQEAGDPHEAFLRALEPQLAELKEVSLALGNALDAQNSQLGRLDQKVDTVQDGMKKVSIQTKKVAGVKMTVNYRFRCAFQEIESSKFLRDVDGEASLRCSDRIFKKCSR